MNLLRFCYYPIKGRNLLHFIGHHRLSHLDFHTWFLLFELTFHSLYLIECLFINNRFMRIFHQILCKLAPLPYLSAGQKIRRVGFLHKHLPDVLFIYRRDSSFFACFLVEIRRFSVMFELKSL